MTYDNDNDQLRWEYEVETSIRAANKWMAATQAAMDEYVLGQTTREQFLAKLAGINKANL